MTSERLQYLLDLYLSRLASSAEEQELYAVIHTGEYEKEIKNQLGNQWEELSRTARLGDEQAERMLQFILQQRPAVPVIPWYRTAMFRRLSAAAAVASLLFLSVFYFFQPKNNTASVAGKGKVKQTDIAPGQNGAILRLADGSSIVLDSAHDGILSQQGNAVAMKDGAQLSYVKDGSGKIATGYNTIETPRGRQFQITLEDGTKVWLNASSSIRFPIVFNGAERPVEITGEVYFEVARNKEKPFVVRSGDMQVQVLGTHFNVNAYKDESTINTTLIEGSVRISKGKTAGMLKPGQQAQVSGAGSLRIKEHADIEEVLSWKNGRIAFTNADLESIMRQVSKWYDVDVEYAGPVPNRTFTADISRNTNLSEFLRVLEISNIHFRIEGRKLIVLP
ncbi:MAG: FecR domain-containing protein [Lacibacter sp.]